jgi:hypothetical protein
MVSLAWCESIEGRKREEGRRRGEGAIRSRIKKLGGDTEKMKKLRIAILAMTLLTMSIGMATAVPMIYDISYDPGTNETYITNNATSQSALELHGHNNGEIVNTVWLSPGDPITFYDDGTHSPYKEGTTIVRPINQEKKDYTVSGTFKSRSKCPGGGWSSWTTGITSITIPKGNKCCYEFKGDKDKFKVEGCLIEPILDETDILINPLERPSYLPANQFLIKLLSGGLRVETDTDEFVTVMTKSSGSGGVHVGCIPEFTTIAIPVAAIIGLLFLFSRRRRKE